MKKILLLSDTHSFIDNVILKYAKKADEIWHAGDIGNIEVYDKLEKITKTRAVYGNIDDYVIRSAIKEVNTFICEKVKVSMIHIAGKPPYYNRKSKLIIRQEKPKIFICGHSHILKVEFDKVNNVLFMNPGAAGRHGFHKKRTMIRFEINEEKIKNMEVIELGNRSKLPQSI
ncbi:metallophosphatase family protein [Flavobacteriaceae bacterium]|nr:metallophosphatase family protein [Flavobacteriaceae bacterium]